jgi:hypothetical protein
MPAGNATALAQLQSIFNAQIPPEGPKALKAVLNFTGGVINASVDLTQQTLPPQQVSLIQGVYIDNSGSTIALVMTVQGTGQIIVCPPSSQMYAPVFAPIPPIFLFNGFGNASPGVMIPVFFVNVPLPAMVWSTTGASGFSFSGGNLLVQDTAAEASLAALQALITAGGLNVNVISGGGGGSSEGPFVWASGFTSTNSTIIYTPASGKRFFLQGFVAHLTPTLASAATDTQISIEDIDAAGSPVILAKNVLPPVSATGAPVNGYEIFNITNIGHRSQVVNGRLAITLSTAFSTGALIYSFGVLQGDTT